MRPVFLFLSNAITALVAAFSAAWRRVLSVPPVEWVVYDLHGALERGDVTRLPSWVWRLPRGPRVRSVAQLHHELEFLRATTVRGVVVKLRDLRCSPAVLRELRATLEAFRSDGREVVFHADHLGNREYWLASVGTRVWLTPRGRLELIGFASSSSAAAKPLRWLGVTFDIIRAGTFKSAGELLGADHVSAEQKLQLDELVGDMNALFLSDVARGRGCSVEELQSAVDCGPYSARAALEVKLIDGVAYADEVRARLGADSPGGPRRARVGPFAAVLSRWAPPARWRPLRDRRPTVAVLDVEGMITSGKSRAAPWVSATAGSDSLVASLAKLRLKDDVKAVVLRIDSRGGSAAASDLIWRAARRLAGKKPVIAYLDDVAASGGYYIAAAARQIIAAPTCITGSIGVFMMRPDVSGTLDKLGIDRATVQRGARASIYRTDHPLSEDERAALQLQVRETYDEFIQVVTEGRSLPEERVRTLAEGRVYLATRAKEVGLVDSLGTLEDAIAAARIAAGIEGDARITSWHAAPVGWRDMLGRLRGSDPEESASLLRDPMQALWLGERPL